MPLCGLSQAVLLQVFSTSGNLNDPNMDSDTLAVLTQCAKNMAAYKPPKKAILDKYFELFRGDHEAEADADADAEVDEV